MDLLLLEVETVPTLRSELERSLENWRNHLHSIWFNVLGNAGSDFSQIFPLTDVWFRLCLIRLHNRRVGPIVA